MSFKVDRDNTQQKIRPFCLHYFYTWGLVYLVSSTAELHDDRRLVVHRGEVGKKMPLVETVSIYEESTGYHLVYFYGDHAIASIEYAPTPNHVATPPFLLPLMKRRLRHLRVAPQYYAVNYFSDGAARVTLQNEQSPL